MMNRRSLLLCSALGLVSSVPAFAQAAAQNTAFIQRLGSQMVAIVNGPDSTAQKLQQISPLVANAVDVDSIARFCLGRFARTATPQQIADFQQLFHQVLLNNITTRLGQYKGVTFTMTRTEQRGDESYVGSTIQRPNENPTNVQWVVSNSTGTPKVVDVVAEGTSLRQTQRSDYASFMSNHGNDVNALLTAMRRQVKG